MPRHYNHLAFFSSTSQDNPSDKDINQGTLVVFNLDPSVSNEDLRQIFGAYGEVKEVIILSFLVALYPCDICVCVVFFRLKITYLCFCR